MRTIDGVLRLSCSVPCSQGRLPSFPDVILPHSASTAFLWPAAPVPGLAPVRPWSCHLGSPWGLPTRSPESWVSESSALPRPWGSESSALCTDSLGCTYRFCRKLGRPHALRFSEDFAENLAVNYVIAQLNDPVVLGMTCFIQRTVFLFA